MPSFGQLRATLCLWQRFDGLERRDASTQVALTFDDGPDADATPSLLDTLDAAKATATFFLVGAQVERFGPIAAEIARRGHEIALHGYCHKEHADLSDPMDDLRRGYETVAAAAGRAPARFRPPYGRFSQSSYAACRQLGLEPVYWSAWGCDWEAVSAARIAELVLRDLTAGAIVLLHDSARYSGRPSAKPTVEAVSTIAERSSAAGLSLAAIERLG